MKPTLLALSLTTLIPLAACQSESSPSITDRISQATSEAAEKIQDAAGDAAAKVREEMATSNLRLGGGADGLPKAELSPEGDLIIGGQAIPLDAAQREKVLAFREQLVEVAAGGADIGIQGASLATKALGDAAAAIASGETAGLEAKIEAEADAIRDAAQALCNRIPELRAARDALVVAVPEFAPYAALDKNDLGNCHVEA